MRAGADGAVGRLDRKGIKVVGVYPLYSVGLIQELGPAVGDYCTDNRLDAGELARLEDRG